MHEPQRTLTKRGEIERKLQADPPSLRLHAPAPSSNQSLMLPISPPLAPSAFASALARMRTRRRIRPRARAGVWRPRRLVGLPHTLRRGNAKINSFMEVRARASLCRAARTPRGMLHGNPAWHGIPRRHNDRRQRTRRCRAGREPQRGRADQVEESPHPLRRLGHRPVVSTRAQSHAARARYPAGAGPSAHRSPRPLELPQPNRRTSRATARSSCSAGRQEWRKSERPMHWRHHRAGCGHAPRHRAVSHSGGPWSARPGPARVGSVAVYCRLLRHGVDSESRKLQAGPGARHW